jgi:hypothetical protein
MQIFSRYLGKHKAKRFNERRRIEREIKCIKNNVLIILNFLDRIGEITKIGNKI